jgi:tetratricopeptide (TPR) repeat protein
VKIINYLVIFIIFFLPVNSSANTASKVFDLASESTVVVLGYDRSGEATSLGSGVVLPDGTIATNCHVIEDSSKVSVRYKQKIYPAKIKYSDQDRDICSLEAEGFKAPAVKLGSTMGLRVGYGVYAIGAPRGLELSLSEGIVSSLRPVEDGQYIQITAAISPGSSGGGLFDEKGRLLGLTSFYISGGQSLNFALPVEWVIDLPGRHPVIQEEYKYGSWRTWYYRAFVLFDDGKWEEFLDHTRTWIEVMPQNSSAWFYLGIAYGQLNRQSESINAYRQAVSIDKENAFAWYGLGETYYKLDRYDEAIVAFRQATISAPELTSAWHALGVSYGRLNRYNEAIEACRQSVSIDPGYYMGWHCLGGSYNRLKRRNESVVAFRQAVRIEPENADAWLLLGLAYCLSENQTAALDVVQELRRLDPEKADKLFDIVMPK